MWKFALEYDYCLRVVLIGDVNVEKSSLLARYEQGTFIPLYKNCVPVSFTIKSESFKEFIIRLMVWDSAGAERFGDLPKSFYKNKDIALVVFDLTNRETFDHVDQWFIRAKKHAGKETLFALIGNKNDLSREISAEEAQQKAEKWSVTYMEVSSLTGENVNDIFRINAEEAALNIRRNYGKIAEQL